jgi:hypothetical protein
MVQPAEHGKPDDGAIGPGSGAFTRDRNLLANPLMRPSQVEVVDRILREDVPQVSLSQDDHVIEAFAPDALQKSLAHRIHQGSLNRRAQNAHPDALGDAVKDRAEVLRPDAYFREDKDGPCPSDLTLHIERPALRDGPRWGCASGRSA